MEHDEVPIRIAHADHPEHRVFRGIDHKLDLLFLQLAHGGLEVFDFKAGGRAFFRGLPLIGSSADGEGSWADVILDEILEELSSRQANGVSNMLTSVSAPGLAHQ
jgi:hypothetical protein